MPRSMVPGDGTPSNGAARLGFLTRVAEQPLHRALGLTDGELDRICELLDREPNHFELAVFSLLWSEHCAYKHSALLLKRFPTDSPRVLQGPGENAGVIDLGGGEAVAFKVESHNHPSAVEPFQGAATGVGGILRDIIAMGARPVALLDGLRFGEPGWMFERAVAGIGHYGNCLAASEHILVRNSGKTRMQSIGALALERGPGPGAAEWTATPDPPFEVLSYDPAAQQAVWRSVSKIFKRRSASLLRIRTQLGRSVTVTRDHPMIVVEGNKLVERGASELKLGDELPLIAALPSPVDVSEFDLIEVVEDPAAVVVFPSEWEPTRELRVALRKLMPRADRRHYWLRRRELPRAIYRELEELAGVRRQALRLRLNSPRSTQVPATIPVNADTARLIGYYLAEGCCSRNGSTFKIIWTFGRNDRDREYVEDVSRILRRLGLRYSVEERRSTIAITVSSRLLGRLFVDVLRTGRRSSEKRIPSQFMQGPARLQREVLKGIFRGDGSFGFPRGGSAVRISHSTISRELHEQILLLLQSVGIFPSCYQRPERISGIAGRRVRNRKAFQLEFSSHEAIREAADLFSLDDAERIFVTNEQTRASPFARQRARRYGSFAGVAIASIEAVEGLTDVYDLEVPGSHLFATTGGLITHNCVGVPTVGGDTVFDPAYAGNCLVNAMCVGLLPTERVLKAKARGTGNVVFLYGATTGRDGIGGASVLASQELGEEDADKRPSVQIGDPFTGKKLIESSLELVERGLVESLQDCGAAGLASSLAEMAGGDGGIDVQLDRVPLREEEMEPWEIMISESQERMVAVVRPENVAAVEEVCARWELDYSPIGVVTDTGELRAFFDDETVGSIPAAYLTDEAPRYEVARRPRPTAEPAPAPVGPSTDRALVELLASPNIRSRAWVYRRYDHLVGSRTVRRPGLDAAVLRLRPSFRGLAVSLDGSGRIARLDPNTGGALAVLEAARNVACAGGEPLAITDCLNFGNPEKPEIAWELAEAIEGMAAACEALGIPVVSGNVSLYNETDGRAIHPTPAVGCVGLVPDVRELPATWREGDAIYLAGEPRLSLDGSEYQSLYAKLAGRPAPLDLAAEAGLVRALYVAAPRCSLVHDAAEGGLAVALAEAAIASGIGAELDLPDDATALFGEGGGQAILASSADLDFPRLGTVGGASLLGVPVEQLRQSWEMTD